VAKATVLATGGFSQLYLHSTGPSSNRGDGISAAQRAGARTLDMEFVQFHPTTLYVSGKPRRLLTEALRGSGAKILNLKLQAFVDPLAPRDVVSRAIHEELAETLTEHVWLDLRAIADLKSKFPGVCAVLESESLDPKIDLIPIVPAAHYTLGGVWTDLDGRTSLSGLLAAGEVACTGLHGANRLASTSLLEALVFGERAGASAFADAQQMGLAEFDPRPWEPANAPVDSALVQQDFQHLKNTLWNYIGLVRSEKRLRRAERALVELRAEVESFYRRGDLSDELIGLRHGVLVATLLLYAALRNKESVGTHYLAADS
jgi:L-aspartate oxidase